MTDKDDDAEFGPVKSPSNPHDGYFKDVFGVPHRGGLLLRDHLPPKLSALFSSELPELIPGTFIDERLAPHLTDVLYKVTLKTGGDAFIYTLIEHKSHPDALTPLQLLRYMVRIWGHLT